MREDLTQTVLWLVLVLIGMNVLMHLTSGVAWYFAFAAWAVAFVAFIVTAIRWWRA
jgi:hypothetical protein